MKKPSSHKKVTVVEKIPHTRVNSNIHVYLLLLLSIAFYFNTLFNEYALDDHLVISKNTYTQKGLAGIPDLVGKTSYYGFFKNNLEEATLRYRPLVMISYALECELIKNKALLMMISHLVNILLFAGSIWVTYRLLHDFFFPGQPGLAFIITLLFVIHPIHTESIANIKGRDELFSFFFSILAAWFLFRFQKNKKEFTFILSIVFFAAGLFSKESTLSFLAIFPLMLYFFTENSIGFILNRTVPYAIIAALFLWIRFSITGWSHPPSDTILNNPFINATLEEKYATIIWCMGYYLRLLFLPHPLSYDYTFNQVKLTGFSNVWVLISLGTYLLLTITALLGLRKKTLLSFAILFYFISMVLVSNLVVNLGAFIGERLLFTPSLGFCMATGFLLHICYLRLKTFSSVTAFWIGRSLIAVLIVVAGIKTISRNKDWKNNFTLMTHDVQYSPESMKANDACAINLILAADEPGISEEEKKELLKKAIYHDHKAIEIMPSFTDLYFNLGTSFSRLEELDSTAYFWNLARKQKPDHIKFRELDPILANLYLKRGLQKAVAKNLPGCISDLEESFKYDPANAETWYNYGGALFSMNRFKDAKKAFEKTLFLNPAHQEARLGLSNLANY